MKVRKSRMMLEDKRDIFKLVELFYAYIKGSVELNYFPLGVRIEPTNHCNLRCRMCPTSLAYKKGFVSREKGFMDMGLYKKIIDEMKLFPKSSLYPHITLYLGGESLLHPGIIDMIKIAKKSGFTVHFNTNSVLLTPEISLALLESRIDLINFSFDDVPKEKFEAFRRNSNYDLVLRNIINFLKLKKKGGFDGTLVKIAGLKIGGGVKSPIKASAGFANKFKGLPLDSIDILQAHRWSGTFKKQFISKKEAGFFQEYYPCHMLWRDITIGWNGKVHGCCYDVLGEEVIGDVQKDSLHEVWNNERFRELRRLHQEGMYYKIKLCRGCELLGGRVNFWGFWKDFGPFVKKNMLVRTKSLS